MKPSASVIIPMHNGAEFIRQQLDALLVSLGGAPETEILVIDNRSTDPGPGVVKEWGTRTGAPVRIVPAHDKAGEPHARNVGFQAAHSDTILYCDADDAVSPAWISAQARALDSARYATGPLDTHQLNDPRIVDLRGQALFKSLPELPDGTPFAHGCNMGFQRDTLEELDGFDETYLIACDIEIGVRAARAGIDLAWAPEALVNYRLRSDFKGVYRQARAYGRSRRRIAEALGQDPRRVDVAQQARRVGWLVRHTPGLRDFGGRMKWAWVAGQVTGELGGRLPWQR